MHACWLYRSLSLWIVPGLLGINPTLLMAQDDKPNASLAENELLQIVSDAERKFISLAEAMPEDRYTWRPGEGVRSVGEVYMHVAGNNYWWPTLLGYASPEGIAVTEDYETVEAYEVPGTKEEVIDALKASFAHFRHILSQIPGERLDVSMDIFGTPGSVRTFLVTATVHFHEHLGQSIAYARMNGIVPPWSR